MRHDGNKRATFCSTHQRFVRRASTTRSLLSPLGAHARPVGCRVSSCKKRMQVEAVLPLNELVFFKLQLVMFFEDIRSERQLMRHASDRLSVRWFVGYDLGESLPDHSSLTRIRERYGVEVFRRFFEAIVEQ